MKIFQPDLIIEATVVCDRSCPGCYAPNVVTRKDPEELLKSNPGFFLKLDKLDEVLEKLNLEARKTKIVAIRGGEPTRHPEIQKILMAVHDYAEEVYLETHGHWLLQPSRSILRTCHDLGTIVKISYDSMHGMSSKQLKECCSILDLQQVSWKVAITEVSEEKFHDMRKNCQWVPEEYVFFQRKVSAKSDLLAPHFGVIDVAGNVMQRPTALPVFSDFS